MADQFNDSVARAMGRMSGSSGDSPTSPVKHFTYIRGLDGAQPGDPASTAATRNRQAHGGRQFDYIERLGRKIRRNDGNGWKVATVGVPGSDTYDKLNVLHALRG